MRLAVSTFGLSGAIFFLPPLLPLARAASTPALVLSGINLRSNWAREEKILNINSPEAVVVSIAPSQSERKPMPNPQWMWPNEALISPIGLIAIPKEYLQSPMLTYNYLIQAVQYVLQRFLGSRLKTIIR